MNEKKKRIALLIIALGIWLIAIPLTLGYQRHLVEISDLISGLLFVIFGLFSLATSRVWSGWAVGIVGVWLQMAPLVFWAPYPIMYINDTLVGAIAIVLSFLLAKNEAPVSTNDCPKGWSYNPSGWSHRIPTVALAMLCWFFSRYMAAFQLGYIDHIWDPFFTDGTLHVITSKISRGFPVSDAGLGALCYTLEALLGWQGNSRRWAGMPWLVFAFAFLVIPVGIVSITLIILQPVAVGAWCSWCLATAACMLIMIVLTAGELAAVLQFLKEVRKKGGSAWKVFWNGGKPVQAKPLSRPKGSHPWGVTLSWNLLVSAAIGIWLMASPSAFGMQGILATMNYILGPMIVAFSVIALAEVFRTVRFINILFGIGLIIAPWLVPDHSMHSVGNNIVTAVLNIAAGLLIIALSFRKGRISERYGSWENWIV
jgi:hypothetical protein